MLIDTSAWVHYYNKKGEIQTSTKVANLIRNQDLITVTPVIIQEVLQGFTLDKDYKKALNTFNTLCDIHWFDDQVAAAIAAADIYRACRKTGVTIRRANDCMIAHAALVLQEPVLHYDHDFEQIAKFYPLKTLHYL